MLATERNPDIAQKENIRSEASGASVWEDAVSRREEDNPTSKTSIFGRIAQGSKHRAESNAFKELLVKRFQHSM